MSSRHEEEQRLRELERRYRQELADLDEVEEDCGGDPEAAEEIAWERGQAMGGLREVGFAWARLVETSPQWELAL
jgi:hypothetical protein